MLNYSSPLKQNRSTAFENFHVFFLANLLRGKLFFTLHVCYRMIKIRSKGLGYGSTTVLIKFVLCGSQELCILSQCWCANQIVPTEACQRGNWTSLYCTKELCSFPHKRILVSRSKHMTSPKRWRCLPFAERGGFVKRDVPQTGAVSMASVRGLC